MLQGYPGHSNNTPLDVHMQQYPVDGFQYQPPTTVSRAMRRACWRNWSLLIWQWLPAAQDEFSNDNWQLTMAKYLKSLEVSCSGRNTHQVKGYKSVEINMIWLRRLKWIMLMVSDCFNTFQIQWFNDNGLILLTTMSERVRLVGWKKCHLLIF